MPADIDLKDIQMNINIDNLLISVKQMNYGIFTQSYPKHSHGRNYYELHLICGGEGKLVLQREEFELKKGTLYMTGPGVLHEQMTNKQNPMHEYCLGFEMKIRKNTQCNAFGDALLATSFWIGEDRGECERLFMVISKESKTRLIGCSINIQNAISAILVEMVRQYTGSKKEYEFIKIIPDDRRMNIVDGYFVDQYSSVSEKELGQLLGLSIRQVQRFLKKNYGKTFSQMKREAKINKATELIKNGMSMDDVASLVGYSSTSFFRKVMKSLSD